VKVLNACKLLLALSLLCLAIAARAQNLADRPLTIIVPFAPGGVVDFLGRIIGIKISESLGQQVIVDNRPGAGGIVGAEVGKRAVPDGRTMVITTMAIMSVNPSLYSKLQYDPVKDFEPVTLLAVTDHILVVPNDSPAKSVSDLIRLAKQRNGLNFASQGVGTSGHLLGEMLKARTGVPLSHIAYKGSAPALQDIVAGRVDFMFDALLTAGPFVKGGKMRAIAAPTLTRLKQFPDVPTMADAGYQGIEMDFWFGMSVPAKTPQAAIQKLNQEIVKALRQPDVQQKADELGLNLKTSSPEEFARLIAKDTVTYGKVVRDSGARAD
jgi:tripartite-type tricarboxylate transporter receptor subunit TctC